MDPPNKRGSAFRRKPIRSQSSGLSDEDGSDNENFDLAAATVSDGFRPTHPSPTDSSSVFSTTNNPTSASAASSQARLLSQSPTHEQAPTSSLSKPSASGSARPSSAVKPPRPHDSLTLRSDGANPLQTDPSLSSALASHTDAPRIRPQSPYRGPTGPSHPYQMYPQRTLSNGTASADQATRRGPAHPYALYPQNTVTSGDETPSQIPIGFSTSGDGYQRQIGPDGEDVGGLVGPLGHTEELPPYTRYPDQAVVRKATPTAAVLPEDGASNNPDQTDTGAGGIGVATRNPEFSSTEEDLQPSQSRPSTRSHHDINTAAQNQAEKPQMSKWQRRAKKKLWGIVPYWAICLLIIGVVLVGVILGAVIGTVFTHHRSQNFGSSYPPPFPTPTSDVIPLPDVPPRLPHLPTGTYELPLLIPNQSPKGCLNDTRQSAAWNCNIPTSYYEMKLGNMSNEKATACYNLSLKPVSLVDSRFLWGAQPPNIDGETLTLVNDTSEPRRGPAWWLKVTYDKIVVVAQDAFPPPSTTKRWDNMGRPFDDYDVIRTKKSLGAQNGDKPWICTWPGTTLEVFIYPIQNSSVGANPTSGTATSSAASSTNSVPNPYAAEGLFPYPRSVKLIEKRDASNTPRPFCRQVQVVDNGRGIANVTDNSGNPVQIQINENYDSDDDQQTSQNNRSLRKKWDQSWNSQKMEQLTPCGCLWSS
ncbi:hypothetical protein TGAM01_v210373 [Trichoderma gamsii]|uniref:DUF7820 domain-containing protein n=1 Tax=Trichoderma gamsii TaxID=398673 RepID=A0A2P4Z918_9HYPO|nr:hypothetical protein TGAM01_v210373 [Trichoderma gamsii]PON20772.1 hypothetical protein TGAM01_v210373 [Trichoderma gamsii]